MPTPIFCALGDLHLDHHIWKAHRTITGDAFVGLRSFLNIATELRVPAVYLGDVFDSTDPDSSLVGIFRNESETFHRAGLPQYFIQGNHDKRPVPWCSAVCPYVTHVGNEVPQVIGGKLVAGFDFASKDEIEHQLADLSASKPAPDIVLLHQAVRQALPWEGAWNCDLDWIPDGVRLCLMGDIHQTREFTLRNGGRAWYSGSSHARSVDEMGRKFCLVVHDDLSVQPIELEHRSMNRYCATPTSPLSQLLPQIESDLRSNLDRPSSRLLAPLVWVAYTEDQAKGMEEVARLCHDRAILVEQKLIFRDNQEVPDVPSTDYVPTMQTLLGRLLDPYREKTAYQLTLDLLDPTQDPAETLRSCRDRVAGMPGAQGT